MLKKIINGEIALGFILSTVLWICLLGWATSYAPTNPEKEACYQAAAKSGRSTDECKFFWERTTSDPIALFTLVLAVSTIGLWTATIALYYAGERQLRQLKDTAERQLRAYVFLDMISLPRVHNGWNVVIAWKNTGSTRTRSLTAKVSNTVLDLSNQPLETFDFDDQHDAATFHGLIGPAQSVNQPPIPITDLQMHGGSSDDTAFLIWGWVEYCDVFSPQIRRTEFGFRVRVELNPTGAPFIHLEPTERHNAADEDCMRPIQSAP
jgi:hypothetical protein